MTRRPRIETNEGPPPKYVQIIANVVARPDSTYPIVIKPYKLDISQFGTKVRDRMKFTIKNVSDEDLEISLIYKPEGYFTLDLPTKVEAGKTAEGVLTLTKEAIDKSFEKSFTIQLNDQANSRFTIPVKRQLQIPGQTTGTPAASDTSHSH